MRLYIRIARINVVLHTHMEMLYGIGVPLPWFETLKPRSDTAIIGFAGAYAGGSNTAQYERMLKISLVATTSCYFHP